MTDDLLEFWRARLDEDEAAAKTAAAQQVWDRLAKAQADAGVDPANPGWHDLTGWLDPARRLREADAKRVILTEHTRAIPRFDEEGVGCVTCDWDSERQLVVANDEYCPTVRALAAIYSDHPDYRPEWKP